MSNAHAYRVTYRIGHVKLEVRAEAPRLRELADLWLGDFKAGDSDPEPAAAADIVFTLFGYGPDEVLSPVVPAHAEPIFSNESCRYFESGGRLIVDFNGNGVVVIGPDRGVAEGHVRLAYFGAGGGRYRFIDFVHPVYDLMRMNGLYAHHAAAVCHDGFGLLLVGRSGQGKSSLSADLVAGGFQFLSDDRCFVREENGRYQVIGCYEPFKLFASNVAHLPRISEAGSWSESAAVKVNFDIRSLYPDKIRSECDLGGVLFPEWSPGEASRLVPLSPGRALIDILPLTMVVFDPYSSKAHFEFMGKLAAGTPAAKLILGGDRENWSGLAHEFIARNRRAGNG